MMRTCVVFAVMTTLMADFATADDWPQWMGPTRDGVWHEDGIVEDFPSDGLPVKWRTPISGGYAGPAVADGRVFVTDYVRRGGNVANNPGSRDMLEGSERVICLNAASGKELWSHDYERPYAVSYGCGPRTTPAVDGDHVYTLGAEGDLLCLKVRNGDVVWSKNLNEAYQTQTPHWGYSGHPLIDGDKLICLVGGEGSVVVAFDKRTGNELWKAVSASESGYCPPKIIEAGGARQLLVWDPEKVNSLNPETGEEYWTIPLKPGYAMSVTAPQRDGDFLYVSGIGDAAKVIRLDAVKPAAETVWTGNPRNAVYCSNSTPLVEQGVVYGTDCRTGALRAVDLASGERLWETFEPVTDGGKQNHGTAFLVRNGENVFLFNELGDLVLTRLSRDAFTKVATFHVLEPTGDAFGRNVVWSHPAFANRCVFARNDKEIVCVSLAAE